MLPDEKLHTLSRRFGRITAEMNAGPDPDAYVALAREYAELEPVVAKVDRYRKAQGDLAEARKLAEGGMIRRWPSSRATRSRRSRARSRRWSRRSGSPCCPRTQRTTAR